MTADTPAARLAKAAEKLEEARTAAREAVKRGMEAALKTRVDGPSVHAEPPTGSGAGVETPEGAGERSGPSPVDVSVGTDAAKRTVNVGLITGSTTISIDMTVEDAATLRDMLNDALDHIGGTA